MAAPHVHVVLSEARMPRGLPEALHGVGATASFTPVSDFLARGMRSASDAMVVVANLRHTGEHAIRGLLARLAECPGRTLLLDGNEDGDPPGMAADLPADCETAVGEAEIGTRLREILKSRDARGDSQPVRDEQANAAVARQFHRQAHLAGRLQRELFPTALPRFGPFRFSAVYRPADFVSGDVYLVRRLDRDHVAIALADAEGHGMPAALLTVHVRRALFGRERLPDGAVRILEPEDVLARLNDELVEDGLTACQFVAAVYAVLNTRTGRLRLARAGAPYPILRRASGELGLIRTEGGLSGLSANTRFEQAEIRLERGDAVILYSDGVDGLLASSSWGTSGDDAAGAESAVPADELIRESEWWQRLSRRGVQSAFDQLAARHDVLRRIGRPLDDLTALAVRVDGRRN